MRNDFEIEKRLEKYTQQYSDYKEKFDKGLFSEASLNNASHLNSRIEELKWVLQNSERTRTREEKAK